MIILVMGVCACGKTTIGKLLADALNCPFYDGDDYHSEANRKKMAAGIPLTDEDRKPWLQTLSDLAQKEIDLGHNAIMACSCLKLFYRNILRGLAGKSDILSTPSDYRPEMKFLYLKLDQTTVENRLKHREGHFFNPKLVTSQFEALEEPEEAVENDVLIVDGTVPMKEIVEIVKKRMDS